MPLDWAMNFGNQGAALVYIAGRKNDTTMAEIARSQIAQAVETMRDGGYAPYAKYCAERLLEADAFVERLRNPNA